MSEGQGHRVIIARSGHSCPTCAGQTKGSRGVATHGRHNRHLCGSYRRWPEAPQPAAGSVVVKTTPQGGGGALECSWGAVAAISMYPMVAFLQVEGGLLGSRQWLGHDIPIASAVGWEGTGFPQVMTGPSAVAIPGLGSLPPKLAKRIVHNNFVDMRELLPELWRVEPQQANGSQKKGLLLGPITDFQLWAVLCDTGRCTYGIIPRERPTLHGLPQDHGLCKPELRGQCMGVMIRRSVIRQLTQAPSIGVQLTLSCTMSASLARRNPSNDEHSALLIPICWRTVRMHQREGPRRKAEAPRTVSRLGPHSEARDYPAMGCATRVPGLSR